MSMRLEMHALGTKIINARIGARWHSEQLELLTCLSAIVFVVNSYLKLE